MSGLRQQHCAVRTHLSREETGLSLLAGGKGRRGPKWQGSHYLFNHSFILYYYCSHQYAVPFPEASGCSPSAPLDRTSLRELASSLLLVSLGSSSCLI